MISKVNVVGISDVSVGYGSPQVAIFMLSLTGFLGGLGVLLEPDQLERPPRHGLFSGIMIKRLRTIFHPFSRPGWIQYIMQAAKEVNHYRPEVLVVYSPYSLPILCKLHYIPRFVIYYALEMVNSPFLAKLLSSVCLLYTSPSPRDS